MRGIILVFLLINSCLASDVPYHELPPAFADCPKIVAAAQEINEAQGKYTDAIREEVASWNLAKLAPIVLGADPRKSEREKEALVNNYNRLVDNFKLSDISKGENRRDGNSLHRFAIEMAGVRSQMKAMGLLPATAPVAAPVTAPANGEASTPKKKPKIRAKLADGTVIEE